MLCSDFMCGVGHFCQEEEEEKEVKEEEGVNTMIKSTVRGWTWHLARMEQK
jgi:hypothetical protein